MEGISHDGNACVTEEYWLVRIQAVVCIVSFVSLIADALLHDQVIMCLDSSYGDGVKKTVQGNKQATVATLLSLNLGQYKSQDLRVL